MKKLLLGIVAAGTLALAGCADQPTQTTTTTTTEHTSWHATDK